jgi:hypothetical protein
MDHAGKCAHQEHRGLLGHFLSWKGVAFTLALAAVSYYLLTEHKEHLAVALPYIFLLACPLMHLFGHGHGHRHDKDHH